MHHWLRGVLHDNGGGLGALTTGKGVVHHSLPSNLTRACMHAFTHTATENHFERMLSVSLKTKNVPVGFALHADTKKTMGKRRTVWFIVT